jgi:hypothetical protein
MQTSRHELFVFVEGPTDRFFYHGICAVATAATAAAATFEMANAAELPGETGGKPGLLSFYGKLRRGRKLLHNFKGKQTACVFFLDKDLDDLLGKQLRSRYIVYTDCYDFEGHAFKNGRLRAAAAPAALVEPGRLDPLLADDAAWLASAAERWKDWVHLCLFSTLHNVRCPCTFANSSQINKPPSSTTDAGELKIYFEMVKSASGLGDSDFGEAFDKVRQIADRLYARSRQHRIFKGRWYRVILESDLQVHARHSGTTMTLNNFGDRVISTLLQSLDFSEGWALHFINPVIKILQFLKNPRKPE